jgi:hypothetical protein
MYIPEIDRISNLLDLKIYNFSLLNSRVAHKARFSRLEELLNCLDR